MNKKRLYIVLGIVVCLVIGFFAGQEYTKSQIRNAFTEAFSGLGNSFNDESDKNERYSNERNKTQNKTQNKAQNKTIKDREVKEKEAAIDTSITISKGSVETVSSKYGSRDIEAEITFNDVSFVDEIRPPEPTQSYYHYYEGKEGKTYAVISLKLKNIGGSSFDVVDVLRNAYSFDSTCSAKAVFGGKYSYTADVVAELEKDSKGGYSYQSSFVYIDPLETKDIIVAYSVPNEVKDKDAELNICLGDQKINLDFADIELKQELVVEDIEEN